MKNIRNAGISFITTIILAAIACAVDSNMVAFTVLMLASIVSGGAFVFFANRTTASSAPAAERTDAKAEAVHRAA